MKDPFVLPKVNCADADTEDPDTFVYFKTSAGRLVVGVRAWRSNNIDITSTRSFRIDAEDADGEEYSIKRLNGADSGCLDFVEIRPA